MHINRRQRGVVFLTSILALLVMLIIGVTFMGMAMQQAGDAKRDLQALHALAMADAGLNYFVWRQRYSGSPYPITDTKILMVQLKLGRGEEDRASVWAERFYLSGVQSEIPDGFEIISQGLYRNYTRNVRAILQGAIPRQTQGTNPIPPPQLTYSVFTESDLTVDTSINFIGDIGSNGNLILKSNSTAGPITGNTYAAGAIIIDSNQVYLQGDATYGTGIYKMTGNKHNPLQTVSDTSIYFSGTVQGGATTQVVPTLMTDPYLIWASTFGTDAIFNDSRITSQAQVTTPVLYVNSPQNPGYELNIDTDLAGPLTIFVNGDVKINGNITLGSDGKPVVLIATGKVECGGNPVINGIVWAQQTFGGGTPTVNGSVMANHLASFAGNATMVFQGYPGAAVIPPSVVYDSQHMWDVTSWEMLTTTNWQQL
ncbi:MAG: hypothetical protein ACYDBB_03125 [Armatimonadota bacterium]